MIDRNPCSECFLIDSAAYLDPRERKADNGYCLCKSCAKKAYTQAIKRHEDTIARIMRQRADAGLY